MDVFISHSFSDTELARALVDLLRASTEIPARGIRCSSVDGHRLPAGSDVHSQLRDEVHHSELLIALLTPASLESTYVLFELGARWGAAKPRFPLLACGADASTMPGPLKVINALTASSSAQMEQLIHEATSILGLEHSSPAVYRHALDRFVQLAATPAPTSPLATPEEAGSTALHGRLRNAFVVGCALGSRARLAPFGEPVGTSLGELSEALVELGIGGSWDELFDEVRQLDDAIDEPLADGGADRRRAEQIRTLLDRFSAELDAIEVEIERTSSTRELTWFKLGKSLYGIAAHSVMEEMENPFRDREMADQALTLRSLSDAIELPHDLNVRLTKLADLANKDAREQRLDLVSTADDLAAALRSTLG